MLWSMVSKATETVRRHRDDIFMSRCHLQDDRDSTWALF